MTDKAVQYYVDQDKLIHVIITKFQNNDMQFYMYNDRNDSNIGYISNKKDLKGLADFIYKTIGESN